MATAETFQGGPAARGGLASLSPVVPVVGRLHIMVWLFLITMATPVNFFVGSLSLSPMRLLLILSVIPLTVAVFTGKYGKVLPTDWLLYVFVLWATVCMAMNNPDRVVENIGSMGIELIGGYLIGRCFIRGPSDVIALAKALVMFAVIWFPFAIYESQTGDPFLISLVGKIPGLFSYADVSVQKRMGLERVQLVFAHPIHYGLYGSIAFSLVFVGLKGVFSDVQRWAAAGVTGFCVFLSLSSGAFLAMVLQLGLIFWHYLFRNNPKKWKLLCILFAVAYVTIDLLSNRTPMKVFMSYATFSAHTAYWRALIFQYGMDNVWANPVFGLGLRNWVRPSFMNSGSMDNFWLVQAVRYGIPGFLIIALAYGDLVRRVGFRNFEGDLLMIQLRRAWMFTFLGLSFTLSTVHIWTAVFAFVFMMLGTGHWMTAHVPQGDGQLPKADPTPARKGLQFARQPVAAEAAQPVRGGALAFARQRAEAAAPAGALPADEASNPAAGRSDDTRFTRFGRAERAAPNWSRTPGKDA
ncbi:MAG: hypothetical protein RLZZ528_1162 [Pseudomonadota bacterium]